jgi:hypothetical protein
LTVEGKYQIKFHEGEKKQFSCNLILMFHLSIITFLKI